MPPLHLMESGGRCRLWIRGCAFGEGATLQEAADDLIRRLLGLAGQLGECSAVRISTDLPRPDPRLVALMHEVAQIAARGEDVRERLFGVSPA